MQSRTIFIYPFLLSYYMRWRIEKDRLGPKKVPADRYFGIHTQRSQEMFAGSGKKLHIDLFLAMTIIKLAVAKTNIELDILDKRKGKAIVFACEEILQRAFDEEFVAEVFHTGLSAYMNVNEVIANRAIEILGGNKGEYHLLHSDYHFNSGQDVNDVLPTAVRIASYFKLIELIDLLSVLKEKEFITTKRMNDYASEFFKHKSTIEKNIANLNEVLSFLSRLYIGKTENNNDTHHYFEKTVLKNLIKITKTPWKEARTPIETTQNITELLEVSDSLKNLAVDFIRIADDFRTFGKSTSLNESPLSFTGSSNLSEKDSKLFDMMTLICSHIVGNSEATSNRLYTERLEMMPIIAHNILESVDLLNHGLHAFTTK